MCIILIIMTTTNKRIFVGDFETTVYEGQESTEVWAAASVELNTEDVMIFHSIDEMFNFYAMLNDDVIVYFHNLKFDGAFWLYFLLVKLQYAQATTNPITEENMSCSFLDDKEMPDNTFKYLISAQGQWYTITIKVNGHFIRIRDSLKLLPFSVKKIGKSFGTKHKKLDMEYHGYRYAGCEITLEERQYIKNDVLVIKEALEIMFAEGHKKLTIGSCCLSEFRNGIANYWYREWFPDLYDIEIDKSLYGSSTAGEYIHNAYRGGWCYLVPEKAHVIKHNGTTADVNSLYPSMMSSESGNYYPVGKPTFWHGNALPKFDDTTFYFIRIRTRFYIKKNKLPFVQIKNTFMYSGNVSLTTSDVEVDGKYYSHLADKNGALIPTTVTLTMTQTDYKLFREHYDVKDFEILDGCYFQAETGIFDKYMNKYKKIKMESKGAKRELAKLFLNNLYGKMAASRDSSFKVAYIKENGALGYVTVAENNKKAGYIPIGAAITSYARCFTIRAAQANYHGPNSRGFIYADTDSIHCDLDPDEVKEITVHPTNFCAWKLESCWDTAIFTRQKTYIEHITHEDGETINDPYYQVKCAGMPDSCKNKFISGLHSGKYTLYDFNVGLKISGKLLPKNIKGGILLCETDFQMR